MPKGTIPWLLGIALSLTSACVSQKSSPPVNAPAPILTKLGMIDVDSRSSTVRLYENGSTRLIQISITKRIPKSDDLQGMPPETTAFEAFVKLVTGEVVECRQVRYPTGAPGISHVGHVTFVHDIVIPGSRSVPIQEVYIDLEGRRSRFPVPPQSH